MLRTFLCSAAVLGFLLVGLLRAEDKKVEGDIHKHHAWFVKADQDAKPPTVTFKVKLKSGKEKEFTRPLAADAKIFGEKHDPETLKKFVEREEKDKDKAILIAEDHVKKHIVEIDDIK